MTLRREYLAAMGLENWVLRTRGTQAAPARPATANTHSDTAIQVPTAEPMEFQPAVATVVELQAGKRQPLELELEVGRTGADTAPREAAYDWLQLRQRVAACTRCGLAATRTQTVFGVGNERAQWLIVGEAPGAEEDRQGEPFVGPAGQLLTAMLRAIGLERDTVYIANVLKCRPPRNRDPLPSESAECIPYLERQIALLTPKIMLAVGRIAAQNLLGTDESLGSLRQKVHRFGATQLPLIVTYHPAYLLRAPSEKRKAWEDLKFAREVFARG
jgi:DNA polymerase